MLRSPAFAGIVLAAGSSSRMGTDKALLPFAGKSFLAGAIELLQSTCDFVVVVAGKNSDLLKPVVYANSAYLVVNPRPQLGQFSSLQVGLQAVLDRGRDAACVTLVDRPPALPATLLQLKQAFLNANANIWAVVPQYDGKHGHPVVFGREMMETFLRADPSANARDIEHQHQSKIEYVSVDDPRVVLDINTPEDYSAFCGTAIPG